MTRLTARLEPYLAGDGWALHAGHAKAVLDRMPENCAQTIITSPPYYNLRDYKGNPDQIGLERTPDDYISALVAVFRSAARVLRADGTLWLNIGDSYSSRTERGRNSDRQHRTGVTAEQINTAPLKSLLLIPARLSLALQEDGWIIRNDVIWHKPNAMPSSVTDRLNTCHEHVLLLTRAQNYYFDLDAIKVPASGRAAGNRARQQYAASIGTDAAARRFGINESSPLSTRAYTTRNPGDVWSIPTQGNSEGHFAMFPLRLPMICVAASTRAGDTVLDPFSGCSTTGRAALSQGRKYIGVDVNTDYHDRAAVELARISAQGALL